MSLLSFLSAIQFVDLDRFAIKMASGKRKLYLGAQIRRLRREQGVTQAEMAAHMGMDSDAFQKERGHAKRFETYSMEVVSDEVMNMADESHRQPDAIVEHAEFMGAVTHAIEGLPEREQLIMQLYYVEELNLKEIGEVLEVSESRVSQLLTATVKKLRGSLNITVGH